MLGNIGALRSNSIQLILWKTWVENGWKIIELFDIWGNLESRVKCSTGVWSGILGLLESHIHIYIYTVYGYNKFHRPHPVFSSILYVHVSEMLCTCQRCCARVRDVVQVSQKLCTCHRSCARFTNPLITFMFDCIHTERIYIYMSTTHKTSRRRSLMKAFLATSTSWKGTGNIILLKLNISGLLGVASHGLTLIHIHPNLNVDCYIQKLVFHSFQECAGILGIFSVLDISTCRCASPLISKFTDSDAKRALDSTMFFFFLTHMGWGFVCGYCCDCCGYYCRRLLAGWMLQIPMNLPASTKAREHPGWEERQVDLLWEVWCPRYDGKPKTTPFLGVWFFHVFHILQFSQVCQMGVWMKNTRYHITQIIGSTMCLTP